jgi:hypothetical protein
MATLLKVLNNLPIPNRRGVLHFASELRLPRKIFSDPNKWEEN